MTFSTSVALWIGTYPAQGTDAGSGEGVWHVDVDVTTGELRSPTLATTLPSPSFLARHPAAPVLLAVSETAPGALTALRVGPGATLDPVVTLDSGGDHPCHVTASDTSVWVANYGDGVAAAWATGADGVPLASHHSLHAGEGTGPVADRQEGPHAHQATVRGDRVLVTDLGADVVRRYPVDPTPDDTGDVAARLPAGTGPRHLVVLPDGSLVVAGELDARLHVLRPAGDGWEHAGSVPVSPLGAPGQAYPAHVTLSEDGTRLHVGLRGPDVLAVLDVVEGDPVGLVHRADVHLGAGSWPRHHEVVARQGDDELIVVALQNSQELATVRVGSGGGSEVVARTAWPTPPSCVLVAR
ncbi:6-phosphogluconolactonase (cycloisomerase 2 family) [Isoptericola jiangsuensis]|uniref:6-phosphogluconolactonase (Cycloisomerase 2 family) n=1 Tax=Isoptericola jiangsuensis TaxID=548579 RepID=A0A2A9F1M2_9MICO|nr:beta-propeller fold lactonase family protein [Isoptericola jiangsuensis]PFG44390.1 6-phosphogluconolactonase (cycloisomerase 2 family) [Isoptericola jiangsuensis]